MTRTWDSCYEATVYGLDRQEFILKIQAACETQCDLLSNWYRKLNEPEHVSSLRWHGTLTTFFQMSSWHFNSNARMALSLRVVNYVGNYYEIRKRLNLRYAYNSVQIMLLTS
jgi:hypothetical protein